MFIKIIVVLSILSLSLPVFSVSKVSNIYGEKVKYFLPKNWKEIRYGNNLYLVGPRDEKFKSPMVMISNSNIGNVKFNFNHLKKISNDYYKGRKTYLKKIGETQVKKIPMQFKDDLKNYWYEMGYQSRSELYFKEEITRYQSCKKQLFHIKSIRYKSKLISGADVLSKVRGSIRCI